MTLIQRSIAKSVFTPWVRRIDPSFLSLPASPAISLTNTHMHRSSGKGEGHEVNYGMKRYVAFLRGINISGKNKIPMSGLKACFEELGFVEVKTYLNSGNVIFSSDRADKKNFSAQFEAAIKDKFALDIPVFIISKEELEDILHHAPDWWGNESKKIYDNLIFIMPPATFAAVFSEIGEPQREFEKIKHYQNAVFWSFSRMDYQKTNWWSKTASANVGRKLTIRTANTIRKVIDM